MQAVSQSVKQTDKHIDRQTYIHSETLKKRRKEKEKTCIHIDWQADRHTYIHTYRHTYRWTDRQINRQTVRERYIARRKGRKRERRRDREKGVGEGTQSEMSDTRCLNIFDKYVAMKITKLKYFARLC